MRTVYNIEVNLKKEFINFYEWNKEDELIKLKLVNVYKLSNEDYYNIIKYNINCKEFAEKTCMFCNDFDLICIRFDNEGNSVLRSKTTLEDEFNILELMFREKNKKIIYKKLGKIDYSYYSREEKTKIETINEFLNNNKHNKEIINYLYYELYNKDIKNYDKCLNDIRNIKMEKIDKLYETIKLIEINV